MKRVLAATTMAVALAALTFVPQASAGNLQIRLGGFFPSASSNLFSDDSSLYRIDQDHPLKKSDWAGGTGGIEFSHRVGHNLELGFHLDGFEREMDTSYNDYTRPSGGDIFQTLRLNEVPLGVTLRIVGGSRHSTVRPYIGVGPDIVFWRYEEEGSFIRFSDPTLPIVDDDFVRSEGTALGAHVAAGLRVAINEDIGLLAEGRYLAAGKKTMKDDFAGTGLKIDLNGASALVGFYVNF
jgi:opacity protein-like surface antigen